MPNKVCVIVQNPYWRDTRVRRETRALRSHGYKVSVIAVRDSNEAKYEIVNDIKVYRGGFQKKRSGLVRYLLEYVMFFLFATFKLNALDLREKFDVVHINTLPDFLVFAAIIQKLKGRKIVLDMHEIAPEFFMSKFGVSIRHPVVRLLLFLEKISLRFADEVITVNDPIKSIFQKRAIPNKSITVVMNTMDGTAAKPRGRLPHEGFNCVHHGTLTDLYGVDIAIQGFSKALKHFNDIFFHIYGDGPHLPYLKRLTEELDLQDHVIFHNQIPYDKMINALADMDLGLLPNRKDVFLDLSFSNRLAEYVYSKIPVISSDLDTVKYYFTNKEILYFEAGNVDDLSEQIAFAYTNRAKLQEMAESAYERAKAYNWAIMEQRYLEVVEGH